MMECPALPTAAAVLLAKVFVTMQRAIACGPF